jgi:3-phenylpropionate/trans-cinnamate dioxygenase ferredoxin reductase subunit
MTERGMVIVGAGEAGTRAAVELRLQGWTGLITLIGEENQVPYERPPLSKDCLTTCGEATPVNIINDEILLQHDINFVSGSVVKEIDRIHQFVILTDGMQIPYERLLLATGARPRKLPVKGSDQGNVLYLRTFADALKLRSKLKPGQQVAVIGGGFIGLEVAASAIKTGCSVTLIEVGSRILTRGVPAEIAQIVEARHRNAGVDFKFGVGIKKIEASNDRLSIFLEDGSFIDCDTIVVGIGAVPETTLASQCGLMIENGINVNEMLATCDPNIFAAGDCCSFPHSLYDRKRIRLEAWRNAQEQGTHAARNMLNAGVAYSVVPWFWSDQYDLNLQVTGLVDYGEKTVIRDHLTEGGKLVAASGIGAASIAKDIRIAEKLIEKGVSPDPSDLKNPAVKLKGMLKLQSV